MLAGLRQYAAWIRLGMPDIKVRDEEAIESGETTISQYTLSSTFTQETPLLPVPPTGKSIIVTGAAIYRWRGGKAVEVWYFVDWAGSLQRLGVLPPLG